MNEEVWTVVVAAGSGTRFGKHKQFVQAGTAHLVDRAVAVARAVSKGVVLVVPAGTDPAVMPDCEAVVEGAGTRSGSVRCGLDVVPDSAGIVVVHDAARPLASRLLFERVVAAVSSGADGAVPAIPVADTLKRLRAGTSEVDCTVGRDDLVAVQTPQAFRAEVLRRVHLQGGEATDDAGLVESAGGRVVVVEGDPTNIKVTAPGDLAVAETLLALGR